MSAPVSPRYVRDTLRGAIKNMMTSADPVRERIAAAASGVIRILMPSRNELPPAQRERFDAIKSACSGAAPSGRHSAWYMAVLAMSPDTVSAVVTDLLDFYEVATRALLENEAVR